MLECVLRWISNNTASSIVLGSNVTTTAWTSPRAVARNVRSLVQHSIRHAEIGIRLPYTNGSRHRDLPSPCSQSSIKISYMTSSITTWRWLISLDRPTTLTTVFSQHALQPNCWRTGAYSMSRLTGFTMRLKTRRALAGVEPKANNSSWACLAGNRRCRDKLFASDYLSTATHPRPTVIAYRGCPLVCSFNFGISAPARKNGCTSKARSIDAIAAFQF